MNWKNTLLIILIFLLSGCRYDMYKIPDEVNISLNNNTFDVFSNHTGSELLYSSNIKIINDTKLDTDKVGDFIYTAMFFYNDRKYKKDITYTVKDNVKPIFIGAKKTIEVLVNSSDNLCDKISFGDNYDNKPSCLVKGEYDINSVGEYDNLEFVISDSSGNIDSKSFKLLVVNSLSKTVNNTKPKYVYIEDVISKYKNVNTSIGIDVSKWQGNVDFKKVKDAGVEFVILRIGSQRNMHDSIDIDSKFNEYYSLIKEAGLKVSVYVYNTAVSYQDGVDVANWVIDMLNGDKLDYPIAYDWENWDKFNTFNISLHTLSDSYLAFEKTIKKAGYDAMLYSSKYYLENVWMNYENSNIWLAHYTDKTDYNGKYMLWQMTSLGKVNGITDNTVDIDILYKEKLDK